jgi:hypothetical protein
MDSIRGITIERYAELCAKMNDVREDRKACIKIAQKEGIKKEDWEAAHKAWQSRITSTADMGKTASRFVPLWKAALDRNKRKK